MTAPVQTVAGTWSSSVVTITITGVNAGALLTVVATTYRPGSSSTSPPAAPTDSNGVSPLTASASKFIVNPASTGDSYGVAIWHKQNAEAGTHVIAISIPSSDSALTAGYCIEWPVGYNFDAGNNATDTTPQTLTTGTASNANADGIAVAGMTFASNPGVVSSAISDPPSGWTGSIAVEQDGFNHLPYEIAYKSLAAIAAQSATWTWTDSGTLASVAAIGVYSKAAAASSQLPRQVYILP